MIPTKAFSQAALFLSFYTNSEEEVLFQQKFHRFRNKYEDLFFLEHCVIKMRGKQEEGGGEKDVFLRGEVICMEMSKKMCFPYAIIRQTVNRKRKVVENANAKKRRAEKLNLRAKWKKIFLCHLPKKILLRTLTHAHAYITRRESESSFFSGWVNIVQWRPHQSKPYFVWCYSYSFFSSEKERELRKEGWWQR